MKMTELTSYAILEGNIQNPTLISLNGEEKTVNPELWAAAYQTALDMGFTEDAPEFEELVFSVYWKLLQEAEPAIEEPVQISTDTTISTNPPTAPPVASTPPVANGSVVNGGNVF